MTLERDNAFTFPTDLNPIDEEFYNSGCLNFEFPFHVAEPL
ncbi:11876_t:CDS:2 [Acaulospora morrowiae]|uniref:11876_t:CDS:1 n=1 Tax=Acaulospora morrowiae TaxID=94023 RepID=A0A9N9H3G2_9GLOM|nr:11876_t:CDS:2 [Acaulospora morrowiae]